MSEIFIIFASVCNSVRVICRRDNSYLNDNCYLNVTYVMRGSSSNIFRAALFIYLYVNYYNAK